MRSSGVKLRAMLPLQKTTSSPCWLGLCFPHLSLDLLTRGQARNGQPVAISETIKRRELIIDCNPAAMAAGVKPGIPATAALALIDGLHVVERDNAAEQRALQRPAPVSACSVHRTPWAAACSVNWGNLATMP